MKYQQIAQLPNQNVCLVPRHHDGLARGAD